MINNKNIAIMTTTTVANGTTVYSDSYDAEYASGFRAVLIKLAATSSVTITEQGSTDNANFYDAVDGSGTALGAIATALTSTAGVYVQFSPVLARYNRLKVVAGAASTITSMMLTISEIV